uniref:U6 snRNA-associated Sm-like protein LSm8 n=1 Tax=Timema tahoe TaxID=61484 RepID=A0A7R9IQP9_9NEOP|nr:unnamed protein product [Timema tahoe]
MNQAWSVPGNGASDDPPVTKNQPQISRDGEMGPRTARPGEPGFDQTINLILDESHERVYSTTQGVEQVVLGLHIIRGDNVAVVGELDDNMDSRLDLSSIRAEPLNSVVH